MNATQRKHLMDRIRKAIGAHDPYRLAAIKEPAAVARARAVLAAWEDGIEKRIDARKAAVFKAAKEAEEAVHFCDADKALAAVKKFESARFPQ